jgi:hypothetical protein
MTDKLATAQSIPPDILRIDEKIQALKKKKERIQTQQALLFAKEAQKILKDAFSPQVALLILSETWAQASKTQKEEWRKRGSSFRSFHLQQDKKKTPPINPTPHKS